MGQYRYELEKGNKKYHCPDGNCGKKTFVRYKDKITATYLPEQYGRCDREIKCAYHLNPYLDGYAKMIWVQERGVYSGNWKTQRPINKPKAARKSEPVYIPNEILTQSLKLEGYEQNVFIQNLISRVPFPFKVKDVGKVISQYYLGTVCNGYRAGAITFPFIDKNKNIRAIQVKQFDETNHTTGTDFLHSIIEKQYQNKSEALPGWLVAYQKNELKVSCLFGEHLLDKYTLNPIALVEAPKTAIYGTLYFGFPAQPKNLLWLAVFNLSSLNFDKCKALKNRDVYLFPDLSKPGAKVNCFEKWSEKAKELSGLMPGTRFNVSDLLERKATEEERQQGLDIADYLIKFDYRAFWQPKQIKPQQEAIMQPKLTENPPIPNKEPIFKPTEPTQKVQPLDEIMTSNPGKVPIFDFSRRTISNPEKPDKEQTKAWVDTNGRLFIETPMAETYTIRESIEHYNNRSGTIEFINKAEIDVTSFKTVYIDGGTNTTYPFCQQ